LTTLTQRYPCVEVVFAHSPVQGTDAPTGIEAALEALYGEPLDVILVVRGGGASEDLAAFNSEIVARAMLRSPIPIISGVGHETDTTLADMVADVRAATPTAAAVKATPSQSELSQHLGNLRYTLDYHVANRCAEADMRLDEYAARLRRAAPAQRIAGYQQNLNYVNQKLQQALQQRLTALQNRVERGHDRLTALDPQAVLARGYAIVRDSAGNIIRSTQASHPQQAIHIQFADGQIDATVTTTQ
jgi:exodeoxyribonuclease VII large subunit